MNGTKNSYYFSIGSITLGVLSLFAAIYIVNYPPDAVKQFIIQVFVLTLILPQLTLALAFQQLPKEAALALIGTVIGYVFGKA